MKKVRTHLLATAAVLGFGGTGYAADMGIPMKAPAPPPLPVTTWAGWYIGGHLGAARLNGTATNVGDNGAGIHGPCSYYSVSACSTGTTGLAAGVQVGYDWQDRYFVYGVAADWTWTGLKHSQQASSGATYFRYQAKVDWLASFRGRMGLALDNNLVYFTGGLALGQLKSSNVFNSGPGDPGENNYGSLSKTQVGWVAGLGVAHKFSQQWSFFGEVLYYDLGHATANGSHTSGSSVRNYQTEFSHEVIVGRVGLNYHF
jgi:outer membrane immunogenic protein